MALFLAYWDVHGFHWTMKTCGDAFPYAFGGHRARWTFHRTLLLLHPHLISLQMDHQRLVHPHLISLQMDHQRLVNPHLISLQMDHQRLVHPHLISLQVDH